MVLSCREIAAIAFQLLVDNSRNNEQHACDSASERVSEWAINYQKIVTNQCACLSARPPACGPAFLSPVLSSVASVQDHFASVIIPRRRMRYRHKTRRE